MKQHIEKEYKMLLTKEQYEKLFLSLKMEAPVRQINYYYDTQQGQLRSQGGAMRIREREGRYLFTLKLRKSTDAVFEFEKEVGGCDLTTFMDHEIQSLLKENGVTQPLHQIGMLTTWRSMMAYEHAEVCLDHNIYRNREDYEIEYEYTQPHAGLPLFQAILEQVNLHYTKNCPSKIARALSADTD